MNNAITMTQSVFAVYQKKREDGGDDFKEQGA